MNEGVDPTARYSPT